MKAHKRRRMAGKLATVLLTLAATIQSACSGEEPNRDGVDFFFTDAEWTEYGRRIERSNRSDFSLSVRMGEHRESVRATAHLRGSGSFGCARRNYTLNLYGKRPRFASLDSVTDEFYLLSLCLDHGYVRQHTVLKLWSRLGLFPLQLRYVELTLNGRSQGVYLLVEKLDRIRFSRSGLRALLRRNFRFVKPVVEVKYSRTGEQEARSDYEKTFEEFAGLSGEPLVARFRELMNLDQYLLWLASNALLQNGDYVDELWLLAEDNPTPQAPRPTLLHVLRLGPGRRVQPVPSGWAICVSRPLRAHLLCRGGVGPHPAWRSGWLRVICRCAQGPHRDPTKASNIRRNPSGNERRAVAFHGARKRCFGDGGALPERKRLTRVRPGDRGSYDTRRRAAIEPIF